MTFLAFVNYAALLAVVPMWASVGGAASLAVGSTTGVMMGATIVTQLGAVVVFKLLRLGQMMVIGAVLLGAPTPLYIVSADISWIMMITVVRGVGFALVVLSGATLVADLAEAGRLSSSASLYGTAAALPNLGALPGGVWIAETWGFPLVFWGAGVACLLGAALAVGLPRQARGAFRLVTLADVRRIATPVGIFVLTAVSFGAATTFLPISGPSARQVSLALLVASGALVLGRLGAGILGDRIAPGRLLVPSALLAAAGLGLTSEAVRASPSLLLLGAALLGAAFGAGQNDSFVATVQRLGPTRTGTASTVWNMAYDGGLGLGAVALGWVIGTTGYAGAFLTLALGVAGAALLLQLALRVRLHQASH
ncbi:MFS transporter [Ornithinicoccus halotolerans]|uniref:MFS transporter n=1 Tax=Ornithinicoccus halotolerans TaxID=1748220 RepID=UPI0012956770|nr:MFS transporter [Ornithinicoccus halotolerans]